MVVSTAPEIKNLLDSLTSEAKIPGLVFRAVQRDGTLLYEGATGVRGNGHKDELMTNDTMFSIASCTKLLTAIATLQLVEQSKIALDDTAEKYLPDIGRIQILTAFEEERPILTHPTTKITIRQLLEHTAGFTMEIFNELTLKYTKIFNMPNKTSTKRISLETPLAFEPGTKWEYGINFDWLGLVLEAVVGTKLGEYMQQYIFEPLGITSASFDPSDEQKSRRAHFHVRLPDHTLAEIPSTEGGEVEVHMGGGGIYTTAIDYCKVLQALLNDGVGVTGNRILSKESVHLLFFGQSTPSIDVTLPSLVPRVNNPVPIELGVPATWTSPLGRQIPKAWTFGGLRVEADLPTGRSAGSVWWAGIFNCYWWIDHTKGVAGVLFMSVLPFLDSEATKCWESCEKLIYEGLSRV